MTETVSEILAQYYELFESGHLQQAKEKCEQVIALEPGNAEGHHGLGLIALKARHSALAVKHISTALKIDPNDANYINSLAQAYLQLGKISDAAACYEKAILLYPSNIKVYIDFGNMLREQGSLKDASAVFRRGLLAKPNDPEVQFFLALTFINMKRHEEGVSLYRELEAGQPNHPGILNNLGMALMGLNRNTEAANYFERIIARYPDLPQPLDNLGIAQKNQGLIDAAIASYRRLLAIDPGDDKGLSNLLLTLNYHPAASQAEIYEESLKFDELQKKRVTERSPHFQNVRNEDKILRIGYLSPDFRAHPVAYFTHALMRMHDRTKVRVSCYANVTTPDKKTEQFRSRADRWRSVVGMRDADVAKCINEDGIDILVDLAGHTRDNKLKVFSHRPAPIQVTWLGYPNTTGLRCMDYRLTDAIADPLGDADEYHTEKLFRLKHGFLCYQPNGLIPEVSRPPFIKQRYITFGSFNHLPKISAVVVQVWSEILTRIPHSRLILKSRPLIDQETRKRYLRMFADRGISENRVDLIGWIPDQAQHMATYSKIDICLDPFPYNGTTTTCEALWMGVPVITLLGDRHAGRVGASILHYAGLPEFVAPNRESLIAMAESLSGDTEKLTELRQGLREKMRQSKLMNCQLFAETLEDAYRDMWMTWLCNAD